ncbi:putative cell wall glycoprotein [Aspergillus terreus]|uniref:Putative cell wall glycoprotein n=1 Tax=Aspergillus terreus TaxID=33178 RepID=A0A5M3ZAU8_ASPTE|nr:hypothetical protein ATETN484_0013020900 [Aspergillus terreus]GFF20443.1 putative cell wall glycoprotein [Aspergillus terreus]
MKPATLFSLFGLIASPVLATTPTKRDACAEACNDAHNKCVTKPGANMAYCASEYASCLGYNPYNQDPFVTPTACAK